MDNKDNKENEKKELNMEQMEKVSGGKSFYNSKIIMPARDEDNIPRDGWTPNQEKQP